MEHGLYVLEGKAVYLLNRDWVEVEAGDFMWLRAFCPQACYAGGPGRFRYLLYKDVNRHARSAGSSLSARSRTENLSEIVRMPTVYSQQARGRTFAGNHASGAAALRAMERDRRSW